MKKYKLSKYNYFVSQDEYTVTCTNLINKVIFGLDITKYNMLIDFSSKLDVLKEMNINLFNALYKLGIIVDAEIDETTKIKTEHRLQVYANKIYRLTIIPTLECNFKCWYCYEEHIKGRMSCQLQRSIIEHIKKQIYENRINAIQLDWFGGEPLIYFDEILYPLSKEIKSISKKNNVVFSNTITTNGSLINEKMIRKFKKIELTNFQITLDGSEEFHNKVKRNKTNRNEYKIVIANLLKICDILKKPSLMVRINYTQENIQNLEHILLDIPMKYRDKMEFSFQQVWQTQNKDEVVIDDIIEKFLMSGITTKKCSLELRSYKCYADVLGQAVITHEGKVFKCTARDFANHVPDGFLQDDGEIEWHNEYYRRMSQTTIENQKCNDCRFLPACWGPCSQKILEFQPREFEKICNIAGVEKTIKILMLEFYKKNLLSEKQEAENV